MFAGLSIRHRLRFFALLLLALLVGVGVTGFIGLRGANAELGAIYHTRTVPAVELGDRMDRLHQAHAQLLLALDAPFPEASQQHFNKMNQLESALLKPLSDQAGTVSLMPIEIAARDKFNKAFNAYRTSRQEVEKVILGGDMMTAGQIYRQNVRSGFDESAAALHDWIALQRQASKTAFDVATATTSRLQTLLMAVVALGCLLALFLSITIIRSIHQSVKALKASIKLLASGDLRVEFVQTRRDELGEIAADMNETVLAWRELIQMQRLQGKRLNTQMAFLSTRAQSIFLSAESQLIAVEEVAMGVQAFATSFSEVAERADAARDVSQASGRYAVRSSEQIQLALIRIEHVADTVRDSAQIIEALSDSSRQIDGMVGSIDNIAKQTNLLALNAAIEAARAGESGRGFAVVADEVRKLADSTTAATQAIRELLSNISGQVHAVATQMREGVIEVAESVDLARQVQDSTKKMDEEAQRVVHQMDEIALACADQKSVTVQINHEVAQVAALASQTAEHGRKARTALDQVKSIEQALDEQLEKFDCEAPSGDALMLEESETSDVSEDVAKPTRDDVELF